MRWSGWYWIVLGLALGAAIEWIEINSWKNINELQALQAMQTPSNVMVHGVISNLRFSRLSWTFDLENAGKITCYWRHPPELKSISNGDFIRLRVRLERTPNGLLCVVQERVFDAP